MPENSNQPRKYDPVLGRQNPAPVDAAVLGGLEGVKRRLASGMIEQKLAALSEALKYGEEGLDLLIEALKDESEPVQRTVFWLLHQKRTEPRVRQVLQEYIPLISAVGIDYTRLSDLLAEWRWEEADKETAAVMLKLCDREKEGWLEVSDMEKFPREDLSTIDNLWLKYSGGHFGFSVQKQIWLSVGGKPGILNWDWEAWGQFGSRVGWMRYDFWIRHNDFAFRLNAPKGHLPGWVGWSDAIADGKFLMFGGGFVNFFKGWASLLWRPDL